MFPDINLYWLTMITKLPQQTIGVLHVNRILRISGVRICSMKQFGEWVLEMCKLLKCCDVKKHEP